jgi:hypothetical protein
MKTLLGIFMLTLLLSGCGPRHVNETVQNTSSLDTRDSKEPFVLVNPLKDDPENPSPHNPLIKRFGDIPQVRTYMRLHQKILSGTPLTRDEAIDFFSAEFHLYQSPSTAEALKRQKESKKRDEKFGFSADLPVFRYTGKKIIDFSRVDHGGSISVTIIDPDGTKTIIDPNLNDGEPLLIPPVDADASYDDRPRWYQNDSHQDDNRSEPE